MLLCPCTLLTTRLCIMLFGYALRISLYYIAAPSAPQRPQAFCQVVVWEEPEHTNGDITKYLVKYFELVHEVPGDRNSFVLPTDLPSGTVIRVCAFLYSFTASIPSLSFPVCYTDYSGRVVIKLFLFLQINAVNVAGTGPFVTTTIPSDCAGPLFSCKFFDRKTHTSVFVLCDSYLL